MCDFLKLSGELVAMAETWKKSHPGPAILTGCLQVCGLRQRALFHMR